MKEAIDSLTSNEPVLWILIICLLGSIVFCIKHYGLLKQRRKRNIAVSQILTLIGLVSLLLFGIFQLYKVSDFSKSFSINPLDYPTKGPAADSLSPFNVLGYSFLNNEVEPKDVDNFNCDQIQFSDFLKLTKPVPIGQGVEHAREQAKKLHKSGEYPIIKWCFRDDENETDEDILRKKWMKFCGSSVWLSKYQVHFFVNRVVYSESSHRNHPTISLIYVEIFDKDWNEVKDFSLTTTHGKVLEFPRIMQVNISENPKKDGIMGPEDPRVVLHRFVNEAGEYDEEPIIIFNMRSTEINWSRAMHMFRPFSESTIRLSLEGRKPRSREKNWAPFFDEKDKDHIYFVYNFNPLRIVKCSMEDGVCQKVTGPDFVDAQAKETKHVGALRGGTDVVPIPRAMIPDHFKNRDFWFGIARSHVTDCGCLSEIYRPHSFIISKEGNHFSLDYVTSLFDFNVNPEPWDLKKQTCEDGKSVLIPNSIAYWTPLGETDVMGVTFSEADRTNNLIHVQGFGQHIKNLLNAEQSKAHFEDTNIDMENAILGICSTSKAQQYCKYSANVFEWGNPADSEGEA